MRLRACAAAVSLTLVALVPAPARAASALPFSPMPASAATATDMLLAQNELRYAVGAPTIPADPRLAAAAQAHATYLALNNTGGHYETAGLPGYTGYAPHDRAVAQGFDAAFVSEVATGNSDPIAGVRQLWDAPYHRLGLLHPNAYTVGWGSAASGGGYKVVGDIAYDFGMPTVDVVRSPAAAQSGIPTAWNGYESPSPVPAGTSGPYGYPIMAVWSGGRSVTLRGAAVTADGAAVPIYVAPQQFESDYVVVVPQRPLPVGTIDVRFDITVGGTWSTQEWTFTTAAASAQPATPVSPATPTTPSAASFHSAWMYESAWPTISVGQEATVTLAFKNTGTATWTRGTPTQANLGVNGDDATFSSLGMAVGWPVPDRPAIQDAPVVMPGGITTFTFTVRGVAPGTYALHLRPVIDGITWMEDQGVYVTVAVR